MKEPISTIPNPHTGQDMDAIINSASSSEPLFKVQVWCTMKFDSSKATLTPEEVVTREHMSNAFDKMVGTLKQKMPTALRGNLRPPTEEQLRARAVGVLRARGVSVDASGSGSRPAAAARGAGEVDTPRRAVLSGAASPAAAGPDSGVFAPFRCLPADGGESVASDDVFRAAAPIALEGNRSPGPAASANTRRGRAGPAAKRKWASTKIDVERDEDGQGSLAGSLAPSHAATVDEDRARTLEGRMNTDKALLGYAMGNDIYAARRFEETCNDQKQLQKVKRARLKCEIALRINLTALPEIEEERLHADLAELKRRGVLFPTEYRKAVLVRWVEDCSDVTSVFTPFTADNGEEDFNDTVDAPANAGFDPLRPNAHAIDWAGEEDQSHFMAQTIADKVILPIIAKHTNTSGNACDKLCKEAIRALDPWLKTPQAPGDESLLQKASKEIVAVLYTLRVVHKPNLAVLLAAQPYLNDVRLFLEGGASFGAVALSASRIPSSGEEG